MLFVIACIVCMVLVFSSVYVGPQNSFFYKVLFSFIVSMLLVVIRPSVLTLYLGWEGLGFSSFVLIAWYNNSSSLSNALLTLLLNRVGDAVLLLVISLCYILSDVYCVSK